MHSLSSDRRSPMRRARTFWAVFLAMTLLLAACGDDDDADNGSAPEEEPAEPTDEGSEGTEPTGTPVPIVALVDLTGPSALPQTEAIVEATIDAINADGGLNGQPVEVEIVDTKGDVATAQSAVNGIGDDVVAVVLSAPTVEAAISDALSALGIPIVGVGYQPPVWGGQVTAFGLNCADSGEDFCAKPNFMTIATTFDAIVATQVIGAEFADATKLVMASCAETDSCAQAAPVFEAIAKERGLEVAPQVRISSTAADYTSECIGFIQDGVDFIQLSVAATAALKLIDSCRDQGYEGSFGASGGSVTGDLLAAPATLAGGLNGFPWWVDDEPVAEYRSVMEDAGISENDYAGAPQTAVYSAIRLLQAAVEEHAEPGTDLDGAAALAAMYQLDGEDLDGLIAPVTFTEDNLDRVRACFWPYVKSEDGTLENPVGGLTMECYPEE